MNSLEDLEKKINSELTTKINSTEIKHNQLYIEIDKDDIIDVTLFLKSNQETKFRQLIDVTVVDYPENLPSLAANSIPSNIEFFYIKIPSSCVQDIISSDTLSSISFSVSSSNVSCWNDSDGSMGPVEHVRYLALVMGTVPSSQWVPNGGWRWSF